MTELYLSKDVIIDDIANFLMMEFLVKEYYKNPTNKYILTDITNYIPIKEMPLNPNDFLAAFLEDNILI